MEYKNIICPVDGTDPELSEAAEDAAAYLSQVTDAKLILLYVVEKWYRSEPLVTDSPQWTEIHGQWLHEGRELLEKEAARLKDLGVKHLETVLRDGDAAHEIIALAFERKADLIVMATHRYSPVGKLFMGSVTDKVSKKSPCPVLWVFK